MKKTITLFTCDACKRQEERNDDKTFPFEIGWVRLNRLSLDASSSIEKDNMDFCSKNCLFQMLMNEVDSKTEKRENQKESRVPSEERYHREAPLPPPKEQIAPPNYSDANFEKVEEPLPQKKKGWFGRKKDKK